ncbi:MAG: hypothetical protein A3J42_09895 [Candidatus Dadabacteria bacterium RIFCSPHIGHO2_12_FULL_53_21]|nr:MAG: hypothetical protein A3J42_09895 [Candidatus Dadabacteria bacterium RIFCSPHIGHO2_12_FULL_53_21]
MLRIEIWSKDTIEWSLEGSGDWLQYQQASIKLRSLFPDSEEVELVLGGDSVRTVPLKDAMEEVKSLGGTQNLMLCDKKYEKMMMFVYYG